MVGEWREVTLGDVIELKRGYDLPSRDRRDGPFPIVSSSGISGRHTDAKAKAPGVVIGRYGTLGEVHYITEDYWPLNTALYVRDFKGNDPQFVSYFLRSLDFGAYSDKAAVPGLNRNDLHTEQVSLPPLPEQRAIAHILGTLDDKIDLNRRMNETLEAMTRALFKDWFVDFGPTCAKAEGRAPYLAPEIWDLFPDALDDEDKPVGWVVRTVDHFFEFNPRETIRKAEEVPYLDMAALPTTGLVHDAPVHRVYKSGTKFRDGDTLFARITPCLENGKTAYAFGLGEGTVGTGSTEFIVIRSREPIPRFASYLLARDLDFRRHAERSMTGTSGRQRANVEAIMQYELVSPPGDALWQALGLLVQPMASRMIANARESRTLAQTRDLLLPKLMSGEIRLAEAEKAVEAVA